MPITSSEVAFREQTCFAKEQNLSEANNSVSLGTECQICHAAGSHPWSLFPTAQHLLWDIWETLRVLKNTSKITIIYNHLSEINYLNIYYFLNKAWWFCFFLSISKVFFPSSVSCYKSGLKGPEEFCSVWCVLCDIRKQQKGCINKSGDSSSRKVTFFPYIWHIWNCIILFRSILRLPSARKTDGPEQRAEGDKGLQDTMNSEGLEEPGTFQAAE